MNFYICYYERQILLVNILLRTEGVPERQYEFSLRLFCDCTNVFIWIVLCGKKVYLVKNETYLSRKL